MKSSRQTTGITLAIIGSLSPNARRHKGSMAFAKERNTTIARILKKARERSKDPLKERNIASFHEKTAKDKGVKKDPDVGLLSDRFVRRELQSTCAAFVDCVAGYVNGTTIPCADACGGQCCTGDYACYGFTGKVCMDGSCDGYAACAVSTVNEVINSCFGGAGACLMIGYGEPIGLLVDSCDGNYACLGVRGIEGSPASIIRSCLGIESCENALFVDVVESCSGIGACTLAGAPGGVESIVNSCQGDHACLKLGDQGEVIGQVTDSCFGTRSCAAANMKAAIRSCDGDFSCAYLGGNSTLRASVIDSCSRLEACAKAGWNGPDIDDIVNSCHGVYSCASANFKEVRNSCTSDFSCSFIAAYGGSIGSIVDACHGNQACFQVAYHNGHVGDIYRSCIGENSCFGTGIGADTVGDIVDGCNDECSCQHLAKDGNLAGVIQNGCNAASACQSFGTNVALFGSIIDCCNTDSECKNLSAFPPQCVE